MTKYLWPEFETPRPRGVKEVLRRAGEGISERTKGEIRFYVQSFLEDGAKAARFRHTGFLDASGHEFPLFRAVEEGDPYPVTIVAEGVPFEMGVKARDEADLLEKLKVLFASEPTRKTVFQLLNNAA